MNGNELAQLISQRLAILQGLLETSDRQLDAIRNFRMSELMRFLSEKQAPLNQLVELAEKIRAAANEDPATRDWESQASRDRCRREQDQCERLHLELLAIEAECETALQKSRVEIEQKVSRVDCARQAATQYSHSDSVSQSGGQLDLASD